MTIVEVIVVVVILGLLAAITVPRLVGGEARHISAKAEEVSQVLTALARRDAVLSQALALEYDGEAGAVRILVRDPNPDAREPWGTDALLPSVDMSNIRMTSVEVDGAEMDPSSFRVVLDQFTPRPSLRLVLTDARGGNAQSVEMAATAGQARVVMGDQHGKGLSGGEGSAIDLDEIGKDREAW